MERKNRRYAIGAFAMLVLIVMACVAAMFAVSIQDVLQISYDYGEYKSPTPSERALIEKVEIAPILMLFISGEEMADYERLTSRKGDSERIRTMVNMYYETEFPALKRAADGFLNQHNLGCLDRLLIRWLGDEVKPMPRKIPVVP